jgi:hypothetical protein
MFAESELSFIEKIFTGSLVSQFIIECNSNNLLSILGDNGWLVSVVLLLFIQSFIHEGISLTIFEIGSS